MAKEGDTAAMRLCLERLIPAYKSEAQPAVFDAMKDAEGLTEQGQAIIAAIANGDIAPGDGNAFTGVLTNMAKLIETEELEERITLLEQRDG
jgi:hypothetical protein